VRSNVDLLTEFQSVIKNRWLWIRMARRILFI